MPSILRSLFKSSPPRSRQHRAGRLPPGVEFFTPQPAQSDLFQGQSGRDEDFHDLLGLLHQVLEDNPTRDATGLVRALEQPQGEDTTFDKLVQLLDNMSARDGVSEVTPYRDVQDKPSEKMQRAASLLRMSKKDKSKTLASSRERQLWQMTVSAADAGLALAEKLARSSIGKNEEPNGRLLNKICTLIEAQREEQFDLQSYTAGRGSPALVALREMYLKAVTVLEDVRGKKERDVTEALGGLLQVLNQGPDYLIDLAIVEAVVWQAEVIDPNLGGEMRQVLIRAAANQSDAAIFRRAAESFIAILSTLPKDQLDDQEAVEAYKAIGALVKQLQMRLSVSRSVTPTESPTPVPSRFSLSLLGNDTPDTATGSPLVLSPLPSQPTSRSGTPDQDMNFTNIYSASELQARYGTGALPTTSRNTSLAPNPAPPPPESPSSPSDTDSEGPEVWEYRGNLLTRSALSLVLRQEALAKADSSGQYAGEVSWDDVRNAWIPKWAEKAKTGELAEGELPSLDPADFKVKRKDTWGNMIGWRDGVMHHLQEPSFD